MSPKQLMIVDNNVNFIQQQSISLRKTANKTPVILTALTGLIIIALDWKNYSFSEK